MLHDEPAPAEDTEKPLTRRNQRIRSRVRTRETSNQPQETTKGSNSMIAYSAENANTTETANTAVSCQEFHSMYAEEFGGVEVKLLSEEEYEKILSDHDALWAEGEDLETQVLYTLKAAQLRLIHTLRTTDKIDELSLDSRLADLEELEVDTLPHRIRGGLLWGEKIKDTERIEFLEELVYLMCFGFKLDKKLDRGMLIETALIQFFTEAKGCPYELREVQDAVTEVVNSWTTNPILDVRDVQGEINTYDPYRREAIQGCYLRKGLPHRVGADSSEAGMVDLIHRIWGADLRYVEDFKYFIRWNPRAGVWRRVYNDLGAVPFRLLQEIWGQLTSDLKRLVAIEKEKEDKDPELLEELEETLKRVSAWNRSLKTTSVRRAVVQQLQADPRFTIRSSQLDKHIRLLNLKNGTWDMDLRLIRPHHKDDLLTQRANVAFKEGAEPRHFDTAMYSIFSEDPESLATFYRHLGATADGYVYHPYMVFLHGDSNNGKTLILKMMASIFGLSDTDGEESGYYKKARTQLIVGPRGGGNQDAEAASPGVAALKGKRCVAMSESEDSLYLQEAAMKRIVDNDTIPARHLYGEFINFQITHTITFATNHLPQVKTVDDGVVKRILVFNLRKKYKKVDDPDFNPDLHEPEDDELISKFEDEEEKSGILNRIIQGHTDWERRNHQIAPSAIIREDTRGYFIGEDTWEDFLSSVVVQGDEEDFIAVRDMASAYSYYTHDNPNQFLTGDKKVNDRVKNSAHMKTLQYERSKMQKKGHDSFNKRGFKGLKFNPEFGHVLSAAMKCAR